MIDNLSLPEVVAQMFVVRASGCWFDHQIRYPEWEPTASKLRYYLEKLGVGGVILVGEVLRSWRFDRTNCSLGPSFRCC